MKLLLVALLLLWSTSAFALLPEREEMKGWIGTSDHAAVEDLYQRYKIALAFDPDARFSPTEISSFANGAATLSPKLLRAMGAPIVFRRKPKPCLFGVGRYSKGCPTFNDAGEFLIYDMPPIQGDGAVQRLAPLTLLERQDLQRRRAVIHAVMTKAEENLNWSKQDRWRDLNGWRTDRKAQNIDAWGYSRYLGQASPKLDLVTFAESYFVRPEQVTSTALDRNESVACQEFTKIRFVEDRLSAIDKSWSRLNVNCPEFERWIRRNELKEIDLLVASASADAPESLYGHLLVHIRYDGVSEGFEPVYQFGAVTPTNVGALDYFTRGLLGGFSSVLEISSFRETERHFLQSEQRNLKRFKLDLNQEQKIWMLQRIWELERRHRYPYIFFRNNCASFLYDLIGTALGVHFDERTDWIVSPTDVLDALAKIDGVDGPLLTKRPLAKFSSREVALRSIKTRRAALAKLGLGKSARAIESKKPSERKQAYIALNESLKDHNATFADRVDIYYASVRIEQYFAEVANAKKKKIAMSRLEERPVYSSQELLERRRELYREEALEKRYDKILAFAKSYSELIDGGVYRDPTESERGQLQWAEETMDVFELVTTQTGDFIESTQPGFDASAYLSEREDVFLTEATKRDQRSTGPSGKGRFSIGGGYEIHDDIGGDRPMARIGAAFIKEKLGEQRKRGFRPDIESIALDLTLQIPFDSRALNRFNGSLTIFRFLSNTSRIGPVRRSFFDTFGWGVDIGAFRNGRRGVSGLLYGSAGLLLPFLKSDHHANYITVGLFADARAGQLQTSQDIMGGGYALIRGQRHLWGNYANVAEIELRSEHHFTLPTSAYVHAQKARAGFQFALFNVGQHPLLLRPFGQMEYGNFTFPERETRIDISTGIDLEFPF